MMPGLVPHRENPGQCNKPWCCRPCAELLIKWNSFLYAVLSYFNLPQEFFIHSIIKEVVVLATMFCWNAILLILNFLSICEKPNGNLKHVVMGPKPMMKCPRSALMCWSASLVNHLQTYLKNVLQVTTPTILSLPVEIARTSNICVCRQYSFSLHLRWLPYGLLWCA